MSDVKDLCRSVFDYDAQPKTPIDCPLCSRTNTSHPAIDRFGYQLGVSACPCGLTYVNPRLSSEAYARFAADIYRPLLDAYMTGKPQWTPAQQQDDQRAYGSTLAKSLPRTFTQHLLDAGGGTGLVARAFGRAGQITVLDPDPKALAQAEGCRTIVGSLDHPPAIDQTFDGILLCRTIEHLCDPLTALRWLRKHGTGWLWVDAVDCGWKVDHPLYWTPKALAKACREAGWTKQRIVPFQVGLHRRVGVICE